MKRLRDVASVLLAVIILFPLAYALSASFFAKGDFTTLPARFLPSTFTPSNYVRVFASSNLARYLYNSLVTAIMGTGLRMVVCLAAAYSLTTFEYRGREAIFLILVASMLLPGDALLLANYLEVRRMGLVNTYLGLVVTGIFSPTAVFLLRQYFLTVSPEYREAAYLEGCSDLRFMMTMLAPMSKSVLLAIAVQSFTGYFNAYLWPLLVTSRDSMRTVQVGLTMLGFSETYDLGPQFAAIVFLTAPMLLLVLAMRRRIFEGISTRFSGR